ncbi:hypothetical protein TKK_0016537 [Trichogramma kaykai]
MDTESEIKFAIIMCPDDKVRRYCQPIEVIFDNKKDNHIQPKSCTDFVKNKLYNVYWRVCNKNCKIEDKCCSFYKGQIISLGDSEQKAWDNANKNQNRIIWKKKYSSSEQTESTDENVDTTKVKIDRERTKYSQKNSNSISRKRSYSQRSRSSSNSNSEAKSPRTGSKINPVGKLKSHKYKLLSSSSSESDSPESVIKTNLVNKPNFPPPKPRSVLESNASSLNPRKSRLRSIAASNPGEQRSFGSLNAPEERSRSGSIVATNPREERSRSRSCTPLNVRQQRFRTRSRLPLNPPIHRQNRRGNRRRQNFRPVVEIDNEIIEEQPQRDPNYPKLITYVRHLYTMYEKLDLLHPIVRPENRYARYELVGGEIYLGQGIFIGEKSWIMAKMKNLSRFERDIALKVWGSKKNLANKCMIPNYDSVIFPELGPVQLISPNKFELYLSIIEDYINEKYPESTDTWKYKKIHEAPTRLSSHIRDLRRALGVQ